MKRKLILLTSFFILFIQVIAFAQAPAGHTGPTGPTGATGATAVWNGKVDSFGSYLVLLLPLILTIIGFLFINAKLKGFDLKEALKENEPSPKTILNPEYNPANLQLLANNAAIVSVLPATIQVDGDYAKSSSRYLALLTSVVALILSISLITFYIYVYLTTGTSPDLGKVSSVLLSLGIGVVPYAFNRVGNGMK